MSTPNCKPPECLLKNVWCQTSTGNKFVKCAKCLCWYQLKMSECQTKAGNQECFDNLKNFHFHYFRYFHYFHYFHSFIHSISTCWTTLVFMSMLKSHSHTLSLSLLSPLSLLSQLSPSHSLTLDMRNKFCLHVHAQKSLFIAENCNAFFLPHPQHPLLWGDILLSSLITLTYEVRCVHIVYRHLGASLFL